MKKPSEEKIIKYLEILAKIREKKEGVRYLITLDVEDYEKTK